MAKRTQEQRDRYNETARQRAAEMAIAAGRIPGKRGQPPKWTEDERREQRRIKSAKWSAANLERKREITRESMKRASDAKALATGRKPGQRGPAPKSITPEEKRAKQLARVKRYYHANLESSRASGAVAARNRRARLRDVGGEHTAADIAELIQKQKGKCSFCLKPLGKKTPHVDHHLPLALGGTNDKANLRILHGTCNNMKSAKHPADFALQNGLLCW